MPKVETDRTAIIRRLEQEGWVLARHGAEHDIYRHPARPMPVVIPRHRKLSIGVGRAVAKAAGWL